MPGAILIVEDDADVREALRDLLEGDGFRAFTAQHGKDALELLDDGLDPGAIVLDWMMPVMNGSQFLEKLAERGDPPPVIVMTAHGGTVENPLIKKVLRKPVRADELLAVIQAFSNFPRRPQHPS